MRRALLAALLLAGCEPEIVSGAYYCGPDGFCPPDLACDGASATCVLPEQVHPFDCGEGGDPTEPDDELAAPFDVGVAGCGAELSQHGCLDGDDDVDHLALITPVNCDEVLDVQVRYPVSFAPVELDLLDDAGAVIATSEVCDDVDGAGGVRACLIAEVAAEVDYVLRIRRGASGDCDGDCAFNRYDLSIF